MKKLNYYKALDAQAYKNGASFVEYVTGNGRTFFSAQEVINYLSDNENAPIHTGLYRREWWDDIAQGWECIAHIIHIYTCEYDWVWDEEDPTTYGAWVFVQTVGR